jgi:plastocyanin
MSAAMYGPYFACLVGTGLRRALVLGALALGAGLVHAAGPADAAAATASDASAYQVDIRNFVFAPAKLTVPAGARVVWTNHDDDAHLVVSTNGAFKASPALDTDESYATVFAKPGTYAYYCGIHPMMVGTIVVR